MFGHRTSTDHDVVAAAQRRLAALAAQSQAPQRPGQHARPAEQSESAEPPPELPVPDPAAARHASSRGVALGRLGITAQQVTVAALVVVAVVVAGAWWALRSVPQAHPVPLTSRHLLPHGTGSDPSSTPAHPTPSSSAGGAAAGGSGPPTQSASLVVDVAGKVRRPGIVELPAGSRVIDAITAAGGARPGVSLTSLNLARLLVDGEQIVVGVDIPRVGGSVAAPGSQVTSGAAAIAPVDLNTATAEQLDTLPDIGPVTAQAILQWRSDNGPFSSVDDLLDVSGIGDATMADIRPYVYV